LRGLSSLVPHAEGATPIPPHDKPRPGCRLLERLHQALGLVGEQQFEVGFSTAGGGVLA